MGAEQSRPDAAAAAAEPIGEATSANPEPNESNAGATPSALVLVGPSGVGKGTLAKRLIQGSDQFGFSVSHTTRAPRPNEQVRLYSRLCNYCAITPRRAQHHKLMWHAMLYI